MVASGVRNAHVLRIKATRVTDPRGQVPDKLEEVLRIAPPQLCLQNVKVVVAQRGQFLRALSGDPRPVCGVGRRPVEVRVRPNVNDGPIVRRNVVPEVPHGRCHGG